jgi:hypothetical protein
MLRLLMLSTVLIGSGYVGVSAIAAEYEDTQKICALLPAYHSGADASYKPGVDVRGNAVAPANVDGRPVIVKNVVRIPVTVDLAQRFNIPNFNQQELGTPLGMVEVDINNGTVTYNGENLTDNAMTVCSRAEQYPKAPLPSAHVKKSQSAPTEAKTSLTGEKWQDNASQTLPGTMTFKDKPDVE